MTRNKTQRLWLKAKKIIPGGNMMLSKKPELFLPEKWPPYFSKQKDVKFGIWMEESIQIYRLWVWALIY